MLSRLKPSKPRYCSCRALDAFTSDQQPVGRLYHPSKSCPISHFRLTLRDTQAMMQLGDIAMESSAKTAANLRQAERWYRQAAGGDPPQPNAIFQIARIYHEVRYKDSGRRQEACIFS